MKKILTLATLLAAAALFADDADILDYVDAQLASIPEPDFSTSNETLVATIQATAPAPRNYTAVSNAAMNAVQPTNMPTLAWYPMKQWGENIYILGSEYINVSTVYHGTIAHRIFDGWYLSLSTDFWDQFSDVALSGSYNDLSNKPTIPTVPTNVSAFNNDAGYLTGYTESDPVWNAERSDYATKADLSTGQITVNSAEYAESARDAYNANYATLAEGLRDGPTEIYANTIFSRLDAAATTNALQDAAIAEKQDKLPYPTNAIPYAAITSKPTTISGYGITDALKSDFASLTNNTAFTSAVAAVSPPTDTSELEARGFIRIVADDEIYFVTITTTQTDE